MKCRASFQIEQKVQTRFLSCLSFHILSWKGKFDPGLSVIVWKPQDANSQPREVKDPIFKSPCSTSLCNSKYQMSYCIIFQQIKVLGFEVHCTPTNCIFIEDTHTWFPKHSLNEHYGVKCKTWDSVSNWRCKQPCWVRWKVHFQKLSVKGEKEVECAIQNLTSF